MIICHFCQLLELYSHTFIVQLMNHQCDSLHKVKILKWNIMLTTPVNNDHVITKCQQISLTFKVNFSSQNTKLFPAMATIICKHL